MVKKDDNKKKVFKIFMPWNFEKEQAWLEEKAKEGWLLERSFFNNHFVKAEPQEMVYRVDYFSLTSEKKEKEYVALFEESGWEFVQNSFGWHYFRIPADKFDTDIYSDPQSRIDQLKRINQEASGFFFLYFILFIVMFEFETWIDFVLFIPMLVIFIFGFVYMFKTYEKIKALQEELGEEEPLEIKL